MNIEQEYQQANISIDPFRYYLLWLKVTLLKIVSLGLYAPWANQACNGYLLENTRLGDLSFKHFSNADNVFKTRLIFLSAVLVTVLFTQTVPALSWAFQLLMLVSLPGFYLVERRYELNAISLGDHVIDFKLSLIKFYKTMILPVSLFLILVAVIFNSEIIDSQFIASIDSKDSPLVYAEDSYMALAEQEFKTEAHSSDKVAGHKNHHSGEIEQWNENISKEEKEYLGEHEKSHNHGNITLSPLQKYQMTNQGNQFIQYVLTFILLCILWPWIDYKIMVYRISNLDLLGSRDWRLKLGVMSLYRLYIKTLLVLFSLLVFIGLVLLMLLTGSEGSSPEFWSNLLANALWLLPLGFALLLFAFNLLFTWRKQWQLSSLVSDSVQTKNESLYLETLILSLTNTFAVFFSLGLALPWCHLRTSRYFINHFNVRV